MKPLTLNTARSTIPRQTYALAKLTTEEKLRRIEARYRSLYDNMSEGLANCWMLCEAGRLEDFIYLEVNVAFEKLTGLKNIVGKRVTEVIPGIKESAPELFQVIGRVAANGRPEKIEIYLEGLKGWFSISVYSLEPECFTAVFENITERKQVVEALRESELRYRSLFNSLGDAVLVHAGASVEGSPARFVEVNEIACQQLGYTREELLQMGPAEIEGPETSAAARKIREQMATPKPAIWEGIHVTKEGLKIPVEINRRLLHLNGKATCLYTARDLTERKRAEDERLTLLRVLEQSPVTIVITDPAGNMEYVNPAFTQLTGYTNEEVRGENPRILKSGKTSAEEYKQLWQAITTGREWRGEFLNQAKNGRLFWEYAVIAPIVNPAGQITHFLAVKEDITRRKQLEEQLRHAQKMESIGLLAGGVAHDFNNFLAASLMNLELLLQGSGLTKDMRESLQEIQKENQRAANLTRQLLIFSRRGATKVETVDLNALIGDLLKMLRRLLSKNIEVTFRNSTEAAWVNADAGLMEQVVMNLCVNARDAMPQGGRLTLATTLVELQRDSLGVHPDARPGRFVCLLASDTGCGMDGTVLQRIFEPFFTTKELGKGTGLGLATVYGIVKDHNGWVEVESVVGQGSLFRVYLPVAETRQSDVSVTASNVDEIKGGSETILLVEDEPSVRRAVALCLHRFGYEILEAGNAQEALDIWERHHQNIDLLFTDMVMPGAMTGRALAGRLKKKKASLKIIISSGYSAELAESSRTAGPEITFLGKPYRADALAKAVRHSLDKAAGSDT